jgi:predicted nucleic acid-binding protein
MEVVIDSNVLMRTLISQGDIIELFFNPNLKIMSPLLLKKEVDKYFNEISLKSKLSEDKCNELLKILFIRIELFAREKYSEFVDEAKELLKGHDKDIDFVALCLLTNSKLWTYESRMFEIGIGISTKEISLIVS